MDIEKAKAMLGFTQRRVNPLTPELEKASAEMEANAKAIETMTRSKGWELLEDYLKKSIKFIHQEMETCNTKDLIRHQSDAKAIRNFLAFVKKHVDN